MNRTFKKATSLITSCAVALSISSSLVQSASAAPVYYTSSTILENDYDMHLTFNDGALFVKGVTVKKSAANSIVERKIKKGAEIILVDKNGKTTKVKNTVGFDRFFGTVEGELGVSSYSDPVKTSSAPHVIVGIGDDEFALLLNDGTFFADGGIYDQIDYDGNFYYFRTGESVELYTASDLKKYLTIHYNTERSVYPYSYPVGEHYYLSLSGKLHEKSNGHECDLLNQLSQVTYCEGYYSGIGKNGKTCYIINSDYKVTGTFEIDGYVTASSYVDSKTNKTVVYYSTTKYSGDKEITKYYTVKGERFKPATGTVSGITAIYKSAYDDSYYSYNLGSDTAGSSTTNSLIFKNSKGDPFAKFDGVAGTFFTKDHLFAYGSEGLMIINLKSEKIKKIVEGSFYNHNIISFDDNKFALETAKYEKTDYGTFIRSSGKSKIYNGNGAILSSLYSSMEHNASLNGSTYIAVNPKNEYSLLNEDGTVIQTLKCDGVLFSLGNIAALKSNNKVFFINTMTGNVLCKNAYLKQLNSEGASISQYEYSNDSYGVVTSNSTGTKFGLIYIRPAR